MSNEEARKFEIGRRIRQLRTAKDLTTAALAKIASMSPGYLSEVERGLSDISVEKLQGLADALKVPLHSLVGDEVNPEQKDENQTIPRALSDAAEHLSLSYKHTIALLRGQQSLVARRSQKQDMEWSKEKWIEFYSRVKQFLVN